MPKSLFFLVPLFVFFFGGCTKENEEDVCNSACDSSSAQIIEMTNSNLDEFTYEVDQTLAKFWQEITVDNVCVSEEPTLDLYYDGVLTEVNDHPMTLTLFIDNGSGQPAQQVSIQGTTNSHINLKRWDLVSHPIPIVAQSMDGCTGSVSVRFQLSWMTLGSESDDRDFFQGVTSFGSLSVFYRE